MDWTDTGNGTMRKDYSNYLYGIITTLDGGRQYRGELFNCGGFECSKLASSKVTDDLASAQAFLDGEAGKY